MREWDMSDLEKNIEEKREEADRQLLRLRKDGRIVRRRPRNEEEQRVLDRLCIERWKKAEREGKVKYLSPREWYYEPD